MVTLWFRKSRCGKLAGVGVAGGAELGASGSVTSTVADKPGDKVFE